MAGTTLQAYHLRPSFKWKLIAFLEEPISKMAVAVHDTHCHLGALAKPVVTLILKCNFALDLKFGWFFSPSLFKYCKL